MTTDIVILSPHLDDAVLSLGALIAGEVAAGKRVEVVSCFTSGPPLDTIPPERRVFGDYSMRRAEDDRAMALLGAHQRWLDLHERIWREPPLPRTRSAKIVRRAVRAALLGEDPGDLSTLEDPAALDAVRRAG